MSVEVGYTGGFGNNLFQYAVGRAFAEKNGLELVSTLPHPFKTTVPKSGWVHDTPLIEINEGNIDEHFEAPAKMARYYVTGYFQQSMRYVRNRDMIRGFFDFPKLPKNTKDIVVHLRQDDYGLAHRIHWSWYLKILEAESFQRLYIVTMNRELHADYLSKFAKWEPTVVNQQYLQDFTFISSFDKMIIANSTFSWWAAFLGDPSKVYVFKPWLPKGVGPISLIDFQNSIPVDGDFME